MNKRYIVRLSKREREELLDVTKRLKGSSQKVRRAQILLKADVRGPNWNDAKIGEAFSCRERNAWTASKKQRSSPCVWGSHRRDMPTGPFDYWRNMW